MSWIEKNSIRLQDMKRRSKLIVTDDETPATVVAFPEGLKLLRKGKFFWESGGVKPIERRVRKEKAAPPPKPPPPSRECVHLESVSEKPEDRRLSLWWVFPPSTIRKSALKFLSIAAEKLPGMLSARFTNGGGLHGTLRSRPEAFETLWKGVTSSSDHDNLFWHCPQVSAEIGLKVEELEGGRKGIPFVLLGIDAGATTLKKQPALMKELEDLFPVLSEQLGAIYGVIQILQNGERLPIHSRGTWTGIPRLHPWRTWFGGPYPKLVERSLQGSETHRSPGGILLRMPGPPAADSEWCGRYPALPDRILARGTRYYLEPAPFLPRLGE